MNHVFKAQSVRRTKKTNERLGCSQSSSMKCIEQQFYGKMSFEGYGCDWSINHSYPFSKTNFYSEHDKRRCGHSINSRPLYSNEVISEKPKTNYVFLMRAIWNLSNSKSD